MKKLAVIITSIIFVLLIIISAVLYFRYTEYGNKRLLNNEIFLVNNYLNDNMEYDELESYLKNEITKGNMVIIEMSLENYINDLLINYNELKKNTKEDVILFSNINNDLENYLKNKKIKIEEIKNKLESVINHRNDYCKEIKYSDLYKDLVSRIEFDYENIINIFMSNLDKNIESIKYLNNTKNWKIDNGKVVFTKRNSFNDYAKLNNNTFNYELIKDTVAPIINANNITIYKGNSINLSEKIKCNDNVDDNVECNITGNYDVNEIGTYNININSSDISGNSSNKTIKLIVKEEVKNPYYVEIIRNHNVVLVYELGDDNEYTKIVKVFLCSVGKDGSKTPMGTFKTSDKSTWGKLNGNVYGQFYTRIVGSVLFHSVPYSIKDKSTLKWKEYNKLGSAASMGCVRLAVSDAKWLYENLPRGTTVKIYDGDLPEGVTKPNGIKLSVDDPNKGWDPTDPDKNNPWRQ